MKTKTKKQWPEFPKTVSFDTDLLNPCIDAVNQLYDLKLIELDDDDIYWNGRTVDWKGLDFKNTSLEDSVSPAGRLTGLSLKYDLEDQHRTPLEVVVAIAIQLGIEQGKRARTEQLKGLFIVQKGYHKMTSDHMGFFEERLNRV